jgi:hypothetical protein
MRLSSRSEVIFWGPGHDHHVFFDDYQGKGNDFFIDWKQPWQTFHKLTNMLSIVENLVEETLALGG